MAKAKKPTKKTSGNKPKQPLPKLNEVGSGIGRYSKDKVDNLKKSIKGSVAPARIVRSVGNNIKAGIASELPDISNLFGSIGTEFSELMGKIRKSNDNAIGSPNKPTVQQPQQNNIPNKQLVASNQNLKQIVNISKTNLSVAEQIYAELQTLTELTSSVWGVSELQLDMTKRSYIASVVKEKQDRFTRQVAGAKPAPFFVPKKPPETKKEEPGFFEKLLKALGFGLLSSAILGLGGIMTGLLGAVTGIVPGIVAGLSGIVGAIVAGISGLLGLKAPTLPTAQPKTSATPSKPTPKAANKNLPPRNAKGQFTKKPPSLGTKMSTFAKKAGPKLGKVAAGAGRLLVNPATLVGGASLAAGAAIGNYGLQAVSDLTDKVTGGENVIGTKLMTAIDSLSGKNYMKPVKQEKPILKITVPLNKELNRAVQMNNTNQKIENFNFESKASSIDAMKTQSGSPVGSSNYNASVTNNTIIRNPLKTRNDAAWSDIILGTKVYY